MLKLPLVAFILTLGSTHGFASPADRNPKTAQKSTQAQRRSPPRAALSQPSPVAQPGTQAPPAGLLALGGSDDCSTPDALAGSGTFAFDTTSATTGSQQGLACGYGFAENDVWFNWTCPATGVCVWDLCGQAFYNSLVAVYAGTGCPLPGTAIACNDDSACGFESTLQFPCTAGAHYLLQLGGQNSWDVGAGSFTLSVALPPANDGCNSPTIIGGSGLFSFNNTAASAGSQGQNEPRCAGPSGVTNIGHDVWYRWTAPSSGIALVSTGGLTTVDTKIAAYAGTSCPTNGSALACKDDFPNSSQADIFFPVNSGSRYMIQLGTSPLALGGSGQFSIQVLPAPPNDSCSTPTVLSGPGPFAFDNTVASTGTQGQSELLCAAQWGQPAIEQDLWYRWTAPTSGTAVLDTCGLTSVDTKIAIYAGTGCPTPGSALICLDDACPIGAQTTLLFPVTAGSTFAIQLGTGGGNPGGVGAFSLAVFPSPPNDDCTTPEAISGLGTFAFDNTVATTGSQGQDETMCANGTGTPVITFDVWYAWDAPASGCTILRTCNLTFVDTKIAVYAGSSCPSAGSALACNDDECGSVQSMVRFTASAGQTYLIQLGVGAYASVSNGGTGDFEILQLGAGIGDDECSSATLVSGVGSFPFDSTMATTGCDGQSESLCFDFSGSTYLENDVWVRWIAPLSGTAICETCNQTSVDTKLAVYQAASCPMPGTALACNDDNCGLESTVVWSCSAGASYMIQIGNYPGSGGGSGSFSIDAIPPPPNDDCATPIVLAPSGPYAFGLLGASTGTQGQAEALCSFNLLTAIENDIWYEWTAPSSGRATASLCGGSSFDSKLAIYVGSGCPASGTAIACNDDACYLASEACFDVVSGQTYTIQIGTFVGQGSNWNGTFDITVGPSYPACVLDDGTPENLYTWYYGGDIVWLNRFGAAGTTTFVNSIDVMWGSAALPGYNPASNGQLASDVFIWQDGPSQDGDPTDATLLLQVPTTVSAWDTDTYVTIPIPTLSINGVFFVGSHQDNYGQSGASGPVQVVAPMDQNCPIQGVGWFFGNDSGYGTSPVDYAHPGANVQPPRTTFGVSYPSQFCIRAGCVSTPTNYLCHPGLGGVSACPCSNPPAGSGRGCNNVANTGGASITALGVNSLATPTLYFMTAGENPTVASILMQGTAVAPAGAIFGHGVRCAGGAIKRLYSKVAVGGSVTVPNMPTDPAIPVRSAALADTILPGQSRWYQVYYRDTTVLLPGCPALNARFNSTDAAQIIWQP